ncbi:hypothetical protein [Prosthecobacter sp.]|uniref:hypothetical protein n=1 Tax=Prosthecobacter sp. TaxID=1965333 RepID=UPI0037830764
MILRRFLFAIALLGTAIVSAAPGDPIDPKTFKDTVSLPLGTQGTIQFKQEGAAITAATLVADPDGKLPGIRVDFKQQHEFLGLKVKNALTKALRYRAAIRLKGSKDFQETSLINPIMAGLLGYETWKDPIEELVLFDFKLTAEKPEL